MSNTVSQIPMAVAAASTLVTVVVLGSEGTRAIPLRILAWSPTTARHGVEAKRKPFIGIVWVESS